MGVCQAPATTRRAAGGKGRGTDPDAFESAAACQALFRSAAATIDLPCGSAPRTPVSIDRRPARGSSEVVLHWRRRRLSYQASAADAFAASYRDGLESAELGSEGRAVHLVSHAHREGGRRGGHPAVQITAPCPREPVTESRTDRVGRLRRGPRDKPRHGSVPGARRTAKSWLCLDDTPKPRRLRESPSTPRR
jgi:hypothetical protein